MEPTLKFFQGQNVPVEHFEATGRIIFFRFTLSKGIVQYLIFFYIGKRGIRGDSYSYQKNLSLVYCLPEIDFVNLPSFD